MIESILTTAFAVTRHDEVDTLLDIEQVSMQSILLPLSLVFTPIARDARLNLKVVPSSLAVVTDRKIIMRILNNLVTNAISYTETGHVLVGCRRRPDGVAIQVLDTGSGFAGNDVKATKEIEGGPPSGEHGLGLAICRRLCKQIGAQLSITSIRGQGTIVEVFIQAPANSDTFGKNKL